MDGAEDFVGALNAANSPLTGLIVGTAIGALVALIFVLSLSFGFRGHGVVSRLVRSTRAQIALLFTTLGAWTGFVLTTPPDPPDWYGHVAHGLLVAVIVVGGWIIYAGMGLLGEPEILADVRTGRDIRRFRTQVQILRRASQAATVTLTLVFVLLTFPEARAPMASLLASAGLISVVAGLAAQTTLGNVFAGLQLAFTDALRVGDNIVAPGESQPGRVEEITLTYVVVRVWDERRIILPSTEFTTKGFENWTRKSASQLSAFEIQVDWTAPVAEIRAEVQRLLKSTDLWDGRTWSVQVYDLPGAFMTLRITVSGDNWARLQDLRGYLRENLVAWIRENIPSAVPRERLIVSEAPEVTPGMGTDELDISLLADPSLIGPLGGGDFTKEQLFKPDPDAELRAAAPSVEGAHLFSGNPEGEKRASLYEGPGHETLLHRALRSLQRAKDEAALPLMGEFDPEVVKQVQSKAKPGAPTGEGTSVN